MEVDSNLSRELSGNGVTSRHKEQDGTQQEMCKAWALVIAHLCHCPFESCHPGIRAEGIHVCPREGGGALVCHDGQVNVVSQPELAGQGSQNLQLGLRILCHTNIQQDIQAARAHQGSVNQVRPALTIAQDKSNRLCKDLQLLLLAHTVGYSYR